MVISDTTRAISDACATMITTPSIWWTCADFVNETAVRKALWIAI
ncbi:MAG TPA: hypothetical protein VHQ20_01280 [Patescibacteria group bacterium]|nr:hypothetical protein [Patescibacteria group bacterium]